MVNETIYYFTGYNLKSTHVRSNCGYLSIVCSTVDNTNNKTLLRSTISIWIKDLDIVNT